VFLILLMHGANMDCTGNSYENYSRLGHAVDWFRPLTKETRDLSSDSIGNRIKH
jgi:hypothetical protein